MRRLIAAGVSLSTVLVALFGVAMAQQVADQRLAGSWKTDLDGAEITITQSASGWSAAYSRNGVPIQGADPIIVKSASAQHITLVEYTPRTSLCYAGMQQQFELDLSSDGRSLVGKVEWPVGSCGDWDDRGDHTMKWVSVLGMRAQ